MKPLPPLQEQVDTTIHLKKSVAAKATPYGFINIFPGKNNRLEFSLLSLQF